jgi:hypothetical protein
MDCQGAAGEAEAGPRGGASPAPGVTVTAVRVDALFASALQCSDVPTASQVRRAVEAAIRAFGGSGCAGRVAHEFGEHPETAVMRMRWARMAVADAFGHRSADVAA